jgi:hypothetical protein
VNSHYIGPNPADDDYVLDFLPIAGAFSDGSENVCVCDEPTSPIRLWSCAGCAATLARGE